MSPTSAHAIGPRPDYVVCDLRDVDALRAAIATLRARVGPVRVLVNNAGNDDRRPAAEVEPDYWDDRMAVNMRHQFFAAQAVMADMGGGGSIVNMGSNAWMQGASGLIAYTTAKSAIQGLTRSLAREVGTQGDPRQLHRARLDPDRATGDARAGRPDREVRRVSSEAGAEAVPPAARRGPHGAVPGRGR